MTDAYQTTKIRKRTIPLLKHISAETGEYMVDVIHRLVVEEWARIGAEKARRQREERGL